MRLARVSVLQSPRHLARNAAYSICVRRGSLLQGTCVRLYSQATSPIPPPHPTETTSKSSGLNHQLHPTGRPPLSPTSRSSSPAAAAETPGEADPANTATAPQAESETVADAGVSSITKGYRTPLRVTNSSTPIAARDTVKVVYEAPLIKPVRGLKAFSISSLILSGALTPFIMTMEAPIPTIARVSVVTAGTSFPQFHLFTPSPFLLPITSTSPLDFHP